MDVSNKSQQDQEAPPELKFPSFSIEIERAHVAPYIGEHAKHATPMELLNFHASRVVMQKLLEIAPRLEVQQSERNSYSAVKAPSQPRRAAADIDVDKAETQVQSWGIPHTKVMTLKPYSLSPLQGETSAYTGGSNQNFKSTAPSRMVRLVACGELTMRRLATDNSKEQIFGPGDRSDVEKGQNYELRAGDKGCTYVVGVWP